jgi:hypothetical protein
LDNAGKTFRKTEDGRLRTPNSSGQLFSGDIAIATMVFLVALALAFFLWNSVSDDINNAEKMRTL